MDFTWEAALAELEARRSVARELGGAERVARKHANGTQTVRERIAQITDRFHEVGELAAFDNFDGAGQLMGQLPSSYVCGLGEVDGRPVAIGGEDFTVRAGAPSLYLDRVKGGLGGFVEDMAHEYRIPLIMFQEGIGGDVATQDAKGHAYLVSSINWAHSLRLLSEVPVLAAVMGAAAGGSAGRAVVSHFSVITKGSVMFAGGPPVVRRALGIEIDKEDLGGAELHTSVSGAIDNLAEDEDDAIAQLKAVLSYLPQNAWELAPRGERTDPVDRRDDELLKIVPENRRRPYKMRRVVEIIADEGSFFEVGGLWGRTVITGFARVDGISVGFVANNPMHLAGALDGPGAQKQTRFVDVCSTFNIPLVYLVDVPGFMVGPDAELGNVVRLGMRAIQATIEAGVPAVTVHVRKAFGLAVSATAASDGLMLRLAWPSAEWGDMPVEGGVEAGYRREIEAAPDPDAYRREIQARLLELANPWKTAEAFGIEQMIDPRETREIIAAHLNAAIHRMRTSADPDRRRWTMRP